jgi:hypothetical protein
MEELNRVDHHGSHWLVELDGRYTVVEERNGTVYGVGSTGRRGHPWTTKGVKAAVGRDGWHDEKEARRLFEDIAQRGNDLAQRLW